MAMTTGGKPSSRSNRHRVVIYLAPLRGRWDEHNVRAQPANFPLNVVHRAESKDLNSTHTNQKPYRSAVNKLAEGQGTFSASRIRNRTEGAHTVRLRVQAGYYSY